MGVVGYPKGETQLTEHAIEPDLPIVDSHHHLKDNPGGPRYLLPEFLRDLDSGHNIVATVIIEVGMMYRAEGPAEWRSLGETEFMNGAAAMFASGHYGRSGACGGIVGFCDLRLGRRVGEILDAHVAVAGGRFRGVRMPVVWDPKYAIPRLNYSGIAPSPGRMTMPEFREGFACLAQRDLSFDVHPFHHQIPELIDLARAFPDTRIITNHLGGPLGIGPYAGDHRDVFVRWRTQVRQLAACPNVFMKLGGVRWAGLPLSGYTLGEHGAYDRQPGSGELAEAWRPYVETCIEAFGAERCMFESNFPPEKAVSNYVVLWNAFKRMTAAYSSAERDLLFRGTAAKAYRLQIPAPRGAVNA